MNKKLLNVCGMGLLTVLLGVTGLSAQAQTTDRGFEVSVSDPVWIAGPNKAQLDVQVPEDFVFNKSNNCLAIADFNGRRFFAFRTAPSHFASNKTRMVVLSSGDGGHSWEVEQQIWLNTDIREPFFLNMNGRFFFTYMVLGANALSFDPQKAMRIEYLGAKGQWSFPEQILNPKEMVWEVKARNGEAWMTSYEGNHYKNGPSTIKLNFRHSKDGVTWEPVRKDGNPTVYEGGVSEVAFEFDPKGKLWAVTRDEDGDNTGWGSHVVTAEADDLGNWKFPTTANPYRHDSPRMFEWNNESFLVARKDLGGKYDLGYRWMGFELQKWIYLLRYSFTPKGFALSWLNRATGELEELAQLPGNGDTSFPSIIPLEGNKFLIANYTAPLGHPKMPWITGQTSKKGSWIYWVEAQFTPTTSSARLPATVSTGSEQH